MHQTWVFMEGEVAFIDQDLSRVHRAGPIHRGGERPSAMRASRISIMSGSLLART